MWKVELRTYPAIVTVLCRDCGVVNPFCVVKMVRCSSSGRSCEVKI
jgi:hypothetical protein